MRTTTSNATTTNKRSMSHSSQGDTRSEGWDLTPGRMTRSAKKLKVMMMSKMSSESASAPVSDGTTANATTSHSNNRNGLMLFSPPNQKANARRQKEENDRKQKEWYVSFVVTLD